MPTGADFVADQNGVELVRLAKLYPFPDFVKKASLEETQRTRPLVGTVFADPVHRQFPCDDAASTWLSALYFFDKKAEFHPNNAKRIEAQLERYVSYWRIKPAYDALLARYQELHKTAEDRLPDSAYGYVWVDQATGKKDRRLPLRNAMETKVAAEWLQTYRDRLPYEARQKIATKIKQAQVKFAADLSSYAEFLDRQAGHGVCSPPEVVAMIRQRLHFAKAAHQKEAIEMLVKTIEEAPQLALQPGTLVKLAATVDSIDRQLGVTGYGDILQRPEDVIFSASFTKAAAEVAQVVATVSGAVYDREALTKLSVDEVRDMFGDEFADQVRTGLKIDAEKMAEQVGALPLPDAQMLESLLSDKGIGPRLRKAASARIGFTPKQLQHLAGQYRPRAGA